MPIEGEFRGLDFRRIRQGSERTGKKSTVWIVAATNNVSKIIERRPTNSKIALDESKQQLVDVVWMKEVKKLK